MACKIRDGLLQKYEVTARAFAAAVADLNKARGTATQPTYAKLLQASEDARLKSERARLALEAHCKEHGC
jgi:hypothetical protein